MLKKAAVQLTLFALLLFGISTVYCQGKIELPAPAKPPHGFVLFTGSGATPYPFHLPSAKDLIEKEEGAVMLQASVKNHVLHGNWKSYYNPRQLMDIGTLIKGVPDGLWQSWYPNGQLKSIRNYSADLLMRVQQDVQLNHPKLSKFVITERCKKEGIEVLYVLRSSYSFNKSDFRFPSNPFELVKINSSNPSSYHPPFVHSIHHGLYINYFENGLVKDSGYYKEGLREGLWIQRSEASGGTWKGMYRHGIRQSEWKYYNNAGKLLLLVFFNKKGEEEWRKIM